MIKLENITKFYEKTKVLDVSFDLPKNKIIALLGANGAGKSTFMKILAGILEPDKGTYLFQGADFQKTKERLRNKIGYLPEENPLYEDMYVKEYLQYVASLYKIKDFNIVTLLLQIGLENESEKKINKLSKGNRQRVGIAQAIMHQPNLILLDEPTSGLDPKQRNAINTILKTLSQNSTIILSTHIISDVEDICDQYIMLEKGKIVDSGDVKNIEKVKELFK